MPIRITLKNYRCFVAPAEVLIDEGFTAFVGVNNAGKSAFIRFFVEFRNLFAIMSSQSDLANWIAGQRTGAIALAHVIDPEEVFSNLNNSAIQLSFEFSNVPTNAPTKVDIEIERNLSWTVAAYIGSLKIAIQPNIGWQSEFLVPGINAHLIDFEELVRLMRALSNTLYIGPFRNIINVGANENYFDIHIGDAFVKQFRELKTGPNKRASIGIQSLIEDVRRIFEFNQLAIDPSADNRSLHITVNGKPFKQHELGSGLSQFIVVLSNAAIKKPDLILIDEPELNLHPRMQLDFLTALGKHARKGVWFSTHSLGLARSAADRIYSVRKRRDGDSVITRFESNTGLAESLGELSFSSHKELGFDKILLVEGPTELKVVQQLLRRKREDHRIVLLSLHGHLPNEEQLEELLRISTNISAMIDSERTSSTVPLEAKRQRFLDLFARKGLQAHVLERRATENYFTDAAVKEAFGPDYRALGPYERLDDISPKWAKAQNWQLAGPSASEIDQTDLGRFLSSL